MHHVRRAEFAHARWKSRRLLVVVSLSFGVGETNCSQGTLQVILEFAFTFPKRWVSRAMGNEALHWDGPGEN